MIELADFIRQRQMQLDLEDTRVAELADIDLDVYLRYKHGDVRKVHTTTAEKIASALKTDVSELLRIAGVRRRRARNAAREVKTSRARYVVSPRQDEPITPADFAELMLRKATQLEAEAGEKEKTGHALLEEAQSLRSTAEDLRSRANEILTAR